MHPLSLLITGFGPFPGASENVSAWLVESLAAASPSSRLGCKLHAQVLPTEWAEVRTLGPNLLDQYEPRLILHFGLSNRARGFRIERSAHNRAGAKDDARGVRLMSRIILEHGQERLDTALPAASLAKHLREHGLPAATSHSAGTYLCNFLYYLSLEWAERQAKRCDVVFVHIPPGPRHGGPLSEAELLRGADAILRYLLAVAEKRDGARPPDSLAPILRSKHRSYAGRE
jgi:pyroglutamyl-peptidase